MEKLISLLGRERVLTAPEDLIPYAFDGTAALKQRPRCVVFPGRRRKWRVCCAWRVKSGWAS